MLLITSSAPAYCPTRTKVTSPALGKILTIYMDTRETYNNSHAYYSSAYVGPHRERGSSKHPEHRQVN